MPTHVVTAFLRHGPDVLLTRRSEAVGTYRGRWAGVSGYAEHDPDTQVREEIREETGLDADDVTLVRSGEPLDVVDGDRHWVVHPYLFDVATRDVTPNEELAATEWVPATAIRDRETVPGLWDAYDRVRPTVAAIRADREHGSAYVSLRALEVLRDEAALAADWDAVTAVAHTLRDARPDMAALRTRVDRAMHHASQIERTPRAVHEAAVDVAARATTADTRSATEAAALVRGRRVATHSRSGTVLDALLAGDPASVVVSESRPGREGVAVAERLAAAGLHVTLTADANLPNAVADCDLALVGADAVHPDGSVVNKVGTRALALGARAADVLLYVACAADKITADATTPTETADPDTLYDGLAELAVDVPLFDVTPGALVAGVVTEDGVLSADAVAERAAEHRRLADWS